MTFCLAFFIIFWMSCPYLLLYLFIFDDDICRTQLRQFNSFCTRLDFLRCFMYSHTYSYFQFSTFLIFAWLELRQCLVLLKFCSSEVFIKNLGLDQGLNYFFFNSIKTIGASVRSLGLGEKLSHFLVQSGALILIKDLAIFCSS